ncbi:hypothetical protein FVE85_7418 [Porphyridium purpureum]|uniref:Plastid lipid-associated protein/fibrillin conserved domain-containing protein n=1 Tax=Porphyridium purpureum TaxID=35688 RepID=A0A5J4ZAR5_PORPP|nr:hypothetical protein FVE85_7418 [Porphyridium purpureum]|eukprot:POR7706..scf295_1
MFETKDTSAAVDSEDFDEAFEEACELVRDIRMGIEFDEDGCEQDDEIEEVLEEIEELSTGEVNLGSGEQLAESWALLYTSSSIARYHRGMSSLHKNFPGGRCEHITLTINEQDGFGELVETINTLGGLKPKVRVNFSWDIKGTNRVVLQLDRLKLGPTSFYADSWKPLRAFTTFDVTFINSQALVCRGATGQLYFWKRAEKVE